MRFLDEQRVQWLGSLVVAAICGCGPHVEGSAVATHTADDAHFVDASNVRVSALAIPQGAAEVGIVQARVTGGNIEDAMPEFRAQVARLGGNFGKLDEVRTKFEMQTRTSTETYSCGTADKPRSCTRSVTRTVEVSTTSLLGKAYRLGAPAAAPPPAAVAAPIEPQVPQEEPAPEPAAAPVVPEGATTAP